MPKNAVSLFLITLLAGSLSGGPITLVAQYHLGEADPGASDGNPGNPTTVDSSGNGFDLSLSGSPAYTNAVLASSLGMVFDGDSYYSRSGVISTAVDNFVLQAWALSTTNAAGSRAVAYNGNSSSSGFGIYQKDDSWAVLFGGNWFQGVPGSVTLNQWTQLTLVRDNGVNTLYINGTGYSIADGPNTPAGDFFIGGNPQVAGEGFQGSIDEVRLFTFAQGTLTQADLDLVPEPATWGTAALSLLALAALKKKASRS